MHGPGRMPRSRWAWRVGVLAALAIPAVALPLAADDPKPRSSDWVPSALAGRHLTPPEAEGLEARVASDPADIDARTRLLGYYRLRSQPADQTALQRHALWMIENRPAEPISGTPFVSLNPHQHGEGYANARALWLRHLEGQPNDTVLLLHAASFFTVYDPELAERFLKKGQELEPGNSEWSRRLGHLYSLSSGAGKDRDSAARSVGQYERALDTDSPLQRSHTLAELAKSAFEAGDLAKAADRAGELLAMVEAMEPRRIADQGDAIHNGNVILGRVALRNGDVEAARDRLRRAGETAGSAVLNSFGPDLSLANELLVKGQREAVLDYLRQCSRFWKGGQDALQHWIAEIQAGKTPELDRHLSYRYRREDTAERPK